jgi:hypothetical protein
MIHGSRAAPEEAMLEASCHCGAVRMEIAARPRSLTSCNCSICRRLGTLWAYYRPDQVAFTAGAGTTVPYVQGARTLAIHRCATCGCVTHWSALRPDDPRMGVNARLLDPAVIDEIPVRRLDGASTWKYLD